VNLNFCWTVQRSLVTAWWFFFRWGGGGSPPFYSKISSKKNKKKCFKKFFEKKFKKPPPPHLKKNHQAVTSDLCTVQQKFKFTDNDILCKLILLFYHMWIKDLKPCYTAGVSVLTGILIGIVINVGKGKFMFFAPVFSTIFS